MKKKIDISVPKSFDDFKLKHVAHLLQLADKEESWNPSIKQMAVHVSAYSNTDIDLIMQCDAKDVIKVFNHCVECLNSYKKKDPPKTIEIKGQVFELIDLEKQTASWLVDYETSKEEFTATPEKFVAMCYVPQGKDHTFEYKERSELFFHEFPADTFFDMNAFFLFKFLHYTKVVALIQRRKLKMKMWKERILQIFTFRSQN
jgi:hypothetical protein